MGQIVRWDFDATSDSHMFGSLILFLSAFAVPHDARLGLAINSTFCTSADSSMLSVRSYVAPILVRQANVEYMAPAPIRVIASRPPSVMLIVSARGHHVKDLNE